MNNITIIGRLGKDAETSMVGENKDICMARFTVAVNDHISDSVDWIKCRQFRCDNLAPYLTTGKLVAVQGRLKVDTYKDKETGQNKTATYILVERTELLADSTKAENTFKATTEKKAPKAPIKTVKKVNKFSAPKIMK